MNVSHTDPSSSPHPESEGRSPPPERPIEGTSEFGRPTGRGLGSPAGEAQREAFVSILSHELRTPITTIYAGSVVLARDSALPPTAAQRLAADISAEAARLYDVVEDLIALARLERRLLDPAGEPVLLQRIVDGTMRVVSSRAPAISVVRSGALSPPPVVGDAGYIEQAARDLVLAAARAAAPPAAIEISLDHDPDGAEVCLRVRDRRPALAVHDLEHAYDLPSSDAAGGSTATIGPFVARHLIEAMGGRVWAVNRPAGGVEFGFALPAVERG
jgi:signal transduction histidine kinase